MERITLGEGELSEHVALAAKGIRDGYIICAPLENGYAFLTNAFSEFAVRAMHVLRGDALGVSAQVLIPHVSTIEGLAREVTPDAKALMSKFWPGQLSINLKPNVGLNWNLGDNKELDLFSVRVPNSEFLLALLKETGPLAVASAARVGQKPARKVNDIFVLESDLAVMVDGGEIADTPATTIVEVDFAGIRVVRIGAIPLSELTEVAPSISEE